MNYIRPDPTIRTQINQNMVFWCMYTNTFVDLTLKHAIPIVSLSPCYISDRGVLFVVLPCAEFLLARFWTRVHVSIQVGGSYQQSMMATGAFFYPDKLIKKKLFNSSGVQINVYFISIISRSEKSHYEFIRRTHHSCKRKEYPFIC